MSKIAIYPGTFDPITFGHVDVIKKGLKLFDKIIVAVSNVDNKNYLFEYFIKTYTSAPWGTAMFRKSCVRNFNDLKKYSNLFFNQSSYCAWHNNAT